MKKKRDKTRPVHVDTLNPAWVEIAEQVIFAGAEAKIERKDGTLATCLVESIDFDDKGRLMAVVWDVGGYPKPIKLSAWRLLPVSSKPKELPKEDVDELLNSLF